MTDPDADKEIHFKTPLGEGRLKGYHLGNVLQMVIAGAAVAGVFIVVQVWNDAEKTWIAMSNNARTEHDSMRAAQNKMSVLMDANTAAVRMQTCINAVPQEQRIAQLRRYSACWYMSQGYAYEELGPQKPK